MTYLKYYVFFKRTILFKVIKIAQNTIVHQTVMSIQSLNFPFSTEKYVKKKFMRRQMTTIKMTMKTQAQNS